MSLTNGRGLALSALSLLLCSACGGLLEIDDLEFTGIPGAGGVAGNAAGGTTGASGGDSGNGNAGSGGVAGTGASAGSGSAGTAGSAGSSTGGAGGCGLGSEYNDANSLVCTNLQVTSGTTYDFSDGALRIVPDATPWYGQSEGSFFYQEIPSGDFAALSRVRVQSLSTHSGVPLDGFAGGGIVLRGPSGVTNALVTLSTFGLPTSGSITYGALPQFTPQGSVSSPNDLSHPFSGALSGFVGMCRSGSVIYAMGQSDQESTLYLLQTFNPQGNFNPSNFTELGTATHMYESQAPDTEILVDYLRVRRTAITDQFSCASELESMKSL